MRLGRVEPGHSSVESRWQCESTTGGGNGSGAAGSSTVSSHVGSGTGRAPGSAQTGSRPVLAAVVRPGRRARSWPTPVRGRDLGDGRLPLHPARRAGPAPPTGGLVDVGRRRAAPATTRVTSPRTSPAAQAASSASGAADGSPRRSWSAPGRPRPAGPARRPRPSPPGSPPSGAAPRRTPSCAARAASSASRRRRSPALRGRKPSKQNRSTGRPETASAVSTADGPGTAVTRMPGLDRGDHQPIAGVGDRRHAGVGDRPPRSRRRAARATSSGVRAASLPSK